MPDFYFLWDKIGKQFELFMPGFLTNEENFMEFLYGVKRVQENILRKSKNKYVIWCLFFCILFSNNSHVIKNGSHQKRFLYFISLYSLELIISY